MMQFLKRVLTVRYFYTVLFYLGFPFIFARLLWRSIRSPQYRERIPERLGFYASTAKLNQCIWVHAVSVGEVIAAIPLVKGLQKAYPQQQIVMTTMTPTGAARVAAAFGSQVKHLYIPYDMPGPVRRFLAAVNPMIAIIMETELWPNLLYISQQKNIPICLVNARLSAKSAQGYARIASLTRGMLQKLHVIAAHGAPDAQRFVELGAKEERVTVTGNIKFDLTLPADLSRNSATLREQLGTSRFIWVAASTHEGEEEIILAAHKIITDKHADALLILVPRHPERFESVTKLSAQQFVTVRRSQAQPSSNTQVYMGDTMGELLLFYAVADVAFVAGSLIPRGGHNMLEAGAQGKPILTGPHLFNFAEISELFVSANALTKVHDASTLAAAILHLLEHPQDREKMGQRALAVMSANKGALTKQLALIGSVIPQ